MTTNNQNNASGAIPSISGASPATPVLGIPQGTNKAKSNVSKLFILIGFVAAGLFIFVGALFLFKGRHSQQKTDKPVVEKRDPNRAKNDAMGNESIDKLKEKLKKQEEAAQLQAQIDAEKGVGASGTAAVPGGATGCPAGTVLMAPAKPMTQPQCVYAGQPGAVIASGPSRNEMRMSGDVLMLEKQGTAGQGAKPTSAPQVALAPAQSIVAPNPYMGSTPGFGAQQDQGLGKHVNTTADAGAFEARLTPVELASAKATRLGNLDFLLKKGTTIPCALKSGIDTTLPGFVTCNVINDVYSANGKVLLIERGASIFGEQRSSVQHGQGRVFALWTRVDNPSGVTADLNSPAVDRMGYSGMPGYVDNKFWDRFGGAILMSIINDGLATVMAKAADTTNGNMQINNTQQTSQNLAGEALKNSLNIPPSVTILPATVVNVMVARDVSFEGVYKVIK